MLIAIDYDGTYTADPDGWDEALAVLASRGHTIICITMRHPDEPITGLAGYRVYYTGRSAKMPWCNENAIKPDIWIEDEPLWLFQSSG